MKLQLWKWNKRHKAEEFKKTSHQFTKLVRYDCYSQNGANSWSGLIYVVLGLKILKHTITRGEMLNLQEKV